MTALVLVTLAALGVACYGMIATVRTLNRLLATLESFDD